MKFIGLYEIWISGLPYIPNIMDHFEATGLGIISNDSNQSQGGSFTDPTIMTNVPWGGSVEARTAYLLRRLVCQRMARHRVREDFLHQRRQQRLWHHCNWVRQWGWDGYFYDGPVTQYIFVQNSVANVSNCFRTVARVGNCVWISCKIALCVTRDRFVYLISGVVYC